MKNIDIKTFIKTKYFNFVLIFIFLFTIGILTFWIWSHHINFEQNKFGKQYPKAISGDEPHYLVIIHSLLFDKDLYIENNYRCVLHGGLQAGSRFQGANLDHHTILVDYHSWKSVLWQDLYDYSKPIICPDQDLNCVPFMPKRENPLSPETVREIPAHPVFFPAIVAVLIAPFSPNPGDVENFTSRIIFIISIISLIFTFLTCLAVGLSKPTAAVSVIFLGLASPWLAYSKSFYIEPLIGLFLIVGLWAVLSNRYFLAGLLVVFAMATKPVFLLVGLGWIIERILVRRFKDSATMIIVTGCGGLSIILFNYFISTGIVISGSGGWRLASGFSSFISTLFSLRYGLFIFTPWAIVSIYEIIYRLIKRESSSQIGVFRKIALPIVLYLILVSMQDGTGGSCYGCRYWISFLPWFAVCIGFGIQRKRPIITGSIIVTGIISSIFAISGALLYHCNWDLPPYYYLIKYWGLL